MRDLNDAKMLSKILRFFSPAHVTFNLLKCKQCLVLLIAIKSGSIG